jgi:hypothetical protein
LIVPPEVQQFFAAISEYLAFVEQRVHETLATYCSKHQYAYLDRKKTLESLSEKVETGRIRSLTEIDDLFGATIIVPTHSHEPTVLAFLSATFDPVSAPKLRGSTRKSPEIFRFDETRFYGRLKIPEGDPGLRSVTFEIQIRSAFEHAWHAVTHDLVYKNQVVDWRRTRLASQLKALVEQADLIAENFDSIATNVRPSEWEEIDAQVAVIEYFKEISSRGLLPEEFVPKDWSRLAQNVVALLRAAERSRTVPKRLSGNLRDDTKLVLMSFSRYLDSIARERLPRSISLFQLVFGVLASEGLIKEDTRYFVLVNDSLKLAFPATAQYEQHLEFL